MVALDMVTLDLRGLRCPLPLLRLKQALHQQPSASALTVLTTDSGALRDIPAFLRQSGLLLEDMQTAADGVTCFIIRRPDQP